MLEAPSMIAARRPRGDRGLIESDYAAPDSHVRVANNLVEVTAAWELVHRVYVASRLIEPNHYGIHASYSAFCDRTAVLFKGDAEDVQATVTAVIDGRERLPLDAVFPDVLDGMRQDGRRIFEIGLFADRGTLDEVMPGSGLRAGESHGSLRRPLIDLMGSALYYGWRRQGCTDLVIGVHPRHARFYCRMFALEECGPARPHPAVRDHPVVMLRGVEERTPLRTDFAPALADIFGQRVDPDAFEHRYGGWFQEIDFLLSPLYGYATWSSGGGPAKAG